MAKHIRSPREKVETSTQIAGWVWMGLWTIGGFALALTALLPVVTVGVSIFVALLSGSTGFFVALQLAKGLDFWPIGEPPKTEHQLKGLKIKKKRVIEQTKHDGFFLTSSDIHYALSNLKQSLKELFFPKKKSKSKKNVLTNIQGDDTTSDSEENSFHFLPPSAPSYPEILGQTQKNLLKETSIQPTLPRRSCSERRGARGSFLMDI